MHSMALIGDQVRVRTAPALFCSLAHAQVSTRVGFKQGAGNPVEDIALLEKKPVSAKAELYRWFQGLARPGIWQECGVRRLFRLDGSAIPSPHRASVEQNVLQFSQGNSSRVHVIQPQSTHFDRYVAKYADRIAWRRSIGKFSDPRIDQKKLLHFPTIIVGNPVIAGDVHKPRCNFSALGRLQHHYPAGPGMDLIHHSTSILSCVSFGVRRCVPLTSRSV